jgi:hypothetical protein
MPSHHKELLNEANVLTFALISLAGSLVYIAVVVALHILPTGYNLVHNAVSDYGVGKYAPFTSTRDGHWAFWDRVRVTRGHQRNSAR